MNTTTLKIENSAKKKRTTKLYLLVVEGRSEETVGR